MNFDFLKSIKKPIFYVTNDIVRGIGLENQLPNYHIVCLDDHPLVDIMQKSGISVFCLERRLGKRNLLFRSAGTIIGHPLVLDFIKEKAGRQVPNILFFKPQKKIETIAQVEDFRLLGNSVEVNRLFEDKVSFFELCLKSGIKVPPGEIVKLGEADFSQLAQNYSNRLVVQFGRGWAGSSTYFVSTSSQLESLKKNFGEFQVKVSRQLFGKTVLNNAVVCGSRVLVSRPALQIKANPKLTANPGGTGGRQWPVILTGKQENEIREITEKVGRLMAESQYQGFFGMDFLVEEPSGEVYLSENNARLTASVPFFTQLELQQGAFPLLGYHLLSFLDPTGKGEPDYEAPLVSGSEIIIRNTQKTPVEVKASLSPGVYTKELEFKKEAYRLGEDESGFWLETASAKRVVNPEIELAKINTFEPVCTPDGELNEKFSLIVEKILNLLRLQ